MYKTHSGYGSNGHGGTAMATTNAVATTNGYDYIPTKALPGTNKKVKVMAERAIRGLPLFHPMDAGMPDLGMVAALLSKVGGVDLS